MLRTLKQPPIARTPTPPSRRDVVIGQMRNTYAKNRYGSGCAVRSSKASSHVRIDSREYHLKMQRLARQLLQASWQVVRGGCERSARQAYGSAGTSLRSTSANVAASLLPERASIKGHYESSDSLAPSDKPWLLPTDRMRDDIPSGYSECDNVESDCRQHLAIDSRFSASIAQLFHRSEARDTPGQQLDI